MHIPTHTHTVISYQPAEASVKDAEPSLVVGHLHKALYIAVIVGAHHPVGVRVDLVNATWCYF